MNGTHATVGFALLVAVTAVVSGPAVPGVDLSEGAGPGTLDPGTGSTTFATVSLPSEGYRIESGGFGDDNLYLVAPSPQVVVEGVGGQLILNYKIAIRDLGYYRADVWFLDQAGVGPLDMQIGRDALSGGERRSVSADEYEAEVSLVVRTNGGKRVVANETVTVTVLMDR